ncbi:MAG: restriction endonuclease subunit S [Halothece sp.]
MTNFKSDKLGNHVDILSGFAFKSSKFSEIGDIPVARIRDIKAGYSKTYYKGEYDVSYLIDNDDILIGMDGEFNCARWKGGQALLNQRVCRIKSISNYLNENYLFYYLPIALKKIEDKTPFVTVKHLSVKKIKAIQIPLPPLEEQKRIAEILDRADAIRQKRKRAIALTEELARSTFLEMFGDPVINPKGWEIKRLQLKTPMSSVTQSNQLQLTLTQLKQQLQEIYQDQLINLILFGSQARGDAEPDSDIDVLVVLAGAVNPIAEIKRNNSLITNLSLETDQLINCIYISEQDWHYLKTPLIQNIYKEGIPV